jgi:hypothetical protein
VKIAYPDDFHPEKREPLLSLLALALAEYQSGSTHEGARLLHEFEANIFLPPE